MKKNKLIIVCIIIIVLVSLLTYLNYDSIWSYFSNKEWQIADSTGKIELENYIATCGTSSNFIVVGSNYINGYSSNAKKNFEKTSNIKNAITYADGDYCIIGEKDSTIVNMISGNDVIWSTDISNASILGVYVNKNGYAAVIYSQAGYKSLIKVFSDTGDELFTNYLASTYAVDVAISNDNKKLAIAEVDANGINVKSRIKIVDIKEASENNMEKYELENNELITDIEFDEKNNLIIMTDANVKLLKSNAITEVINFNTDNVIFASISNKKNIVTVKNQKNGLFDGEIQICINDLYSADSSNSYTIEDIPNKITCLKNIIAIDTGSEVIFLNTSGNLVKRCEYKGQLKDFNLFEDGNTIALIFRDSVEFVKIGGI